MGDNTFFILKKVMIFRKHSETTYICTCTTGLNKDVHCAYKFQVMFNHPVEMVTKFGA